MINSNTVNGTTYTTYEIKAKVVYNSGWQLIIPKMTKAPLLFLEWLSNYRAGLNIVHKVIVDEECIKEDCIKIRLNCTKNEYIECKDYINSNL